MNWIPGLCVIACVSTILPGVLLLGCWYDRRKSNVVDLDRERAQRREPSNVTPFVRREGVRVVPLPRKWGA